MRRLWISSLIVLASVGAAVAEAQIDPGYPYGQNPFVFRFYLPFFTEGPEGPPLLETSAGGVTVRSNLAAGGAIWEWEDGGVQYVNDWDFGRQIQTSFFSEGTNPTEADSRFTDPGLPAATRQGSPVLEASSTADIQRTRSVGLEWNPDRFGGDVSNSVLWDGVELGKVLKLDYAGLDGVAKYSTILNLPAALPRPGATASLEMPTTYLRGEFDHFWTYDAGARVGPTDVTATVPCMTGTGPRFSPTSGFGGVILSNGAGPGSAAMGVYGGTRSVGGPVDYFLLLNFLGASNGSCGGGATGQFDFATSKISVITESADPGAFPVGRSRYDAWISTGDLTEVRDAMDALADLGAR